MTSPGGVPHTFPASVIGGFGIPASGKNAIYARHARVAVRFTHKPDKIFVMSANDVSKVHDEYAFDRPPAGVPRNVIDDLWTAYEGKLVPAIKAIEERRSSMADWAVILTHVHAEAVRSSDFRDRAAAYLAAEHGITDPTKDQLQFERLRTLVNTPDLMAECRFAVVRRPSDGPRFIGNAKGYGAPFEDLEFGHACVVFPLSPEVAVLMVVGAAKQDDDHRAGPMQDLTMTAAAVDMVNEAAWRLRGSSCVFGHPDDEDYILNLDADRMLMPPVLGPFRGTCDMSLCDWAARNDRARRLTIINWERARPAMLALAETAHQGLSETPTET